MSKFIVDELPYYGDLCLIDNMGLCNHSIDECPKGAKIKCVLMTTHESVYG